MLNDAQGHALTGATAEALPHYEQAVRAFTLSYGDAAKLCEAARQASPTFAMAHLAKAWMFTLSNDCQFIPGARALLATARALPLNEREAAHASALAHAVEGYRASAVRILDRHLMRHPRDLIAHFAALHQDAFRGEFASVRDRSARALPFWSRGMPSFGIMRSFYGFGLEEAGNYAQSEDVSREAAALEPYGYWPHHAVSHVLEMTGRPRDGLAWMDERDAFWSGKDNQSRVHIWWHKALFHVELGDFDAALAIYDGPVQATQRPIGISLTNATALLWRLEMLGIDAGDRWQSLAKLWEGHADGKLCLFADVHAAMTAIRAGDSATLDRLRAVMSATAASGAEPSHAYRAIGLPLVDGLTAYHRGDHASALEHLLAARYDLWLIGGSHAQRDVVEWTIADAAIRSGQRDVAVALANERLSHRPQSAVNQRLKGAAEALA